jgi:hypothetical protein
MTYIPVDPPSRSYSCSIPSTNLSSPPSSPSTNKPFIIRDLHKKISLKLFTSAERNTHKLPNRQAPILSSSSLDLTSATSMTLSGTFANLATLSPYER